MISLLQLSTQADPGIFKSIYPSKELNITVSGNGYQNINESLQLTKPEYSIYPWDKKYDWCSNCGRKFSEKPWIMFSYNRRKFMISGYFVRAGCCYSGCCCESNGYCVYCPLYSWALQISNDMKNWEDIHKIEQDKKMEYCAERTYMLNKKYEAKYVRLIQTQAVPGDPPCLAINKFEIFGHLTSDYNNDDDKIEFPEDEDDVSIIGHFSKE